MYENLVLFTLFAPLAAALFAGCFAGREKKIFVGIFSSALLIASFATALYLSFIVFSRGQIAFSLFEWITIGGFFVEHGFLLDAVSCVMVLVVTLISSIVFVYSIGYMAHDSGFNRFFAYLGGFVFSMLFLVLSDNFLGLFVGWEGVGLCSYLLIGFWHNRESANFAAMEAFIMNRIADLGMLLGIILIAWIVGSVRFDEVFAVMSEQHFLVSIAAALLFIGAMGKSAQFPLHTWLANAMEGPTPVSALIHAATMVTAGVYLLVRAHPMFAAAPEISLFVAYLGAFVAVFASAMALVNTDLKRIIAYSTLSQLGYMFVAAGLGAYWIALLHLALHAFFKALLFLGAGNVMHAMDDRLDITKMGGLWIPLKRTAQLMIIASLALAGIFPFAGFFSKDKILDAAFVTGHFGIWAVLLLGAMMTAFYSTRLLMLVFFVPKRHRAHPHEAPSFMLAGMALLAVLSITAGFLDLHFEMALSAVLPAFSVHANFVLIAITTLAVLASIAFGIYAYSRNFFKPSVKDSWVYKLLFNQFYIPQFYKKAIIEPYFRISAASWEKYELRLVDNAVDNVAKLTTAAGKFFKTFQRGNLNAHLMLMGVGLLLLMLAILAAPLVEQFFALDSTTLDSTILITPESTPDSKTPTAPDSTPKSKF